MLNRAVQLDPEFVDAYGWLAFAQHQAYQDGRAGPPNLRSAISNASQALSRDPNALIAIRALSYIQHSAGREIEALVAARRALEANRTIWMRSRERRTRISGQDCTTALFRCTERRSPATRTAASSNVSWLACIFSSESMKRESKSSRRCR